MRIPAKRKNLTVKVQFFPQQVELLGNIYYNITLLKRRLEISNVKGIFGGR